MKWATRKNMKTDRMACAWLIRKYIDPDAEFFFFDQDVLLEEAKKIGAKSFDAAGADYAHVGMHCSFETMMSAYDLWGRDMALDHMAEIVNVSDIRIKLYEFRLMEGFGLWAFAQGFSESMPDDFDKLKFALPMYDALYQWCDQKMRKMKLTHYTVPKPDIPVASGAHR